MNSIHAETVEPLLEVTDLQVSYFLKSVTIKAVDGVSFQVRRGEIVGLLGESGSGKSSAVLAVLRLLQAPGQVVGGDIRFRGRSVLTMGPHEVRAIRGGHVSLIVQDALAALNPVIATGEQVADVVLDHESAPRSSAFHRALEMFRRVSIREPSKCFWRFPHELSGGMQQRVVIAAALVLKPDLIIADEPTTALDVTIQAQILDLLLDIRDQTGSAVLYVTHDLSAAAQVCDRIFIMYAGEIVETGPVSEVFTSPRHPYTRGLLESIPPLGGALPRYLKAIPGAPPNPAHWPGGCRFAERCPLRKELGSPDVCVIRQPRLDSAQHNVACHFAT
jgi:oligopeptide/dipeptide ABC transporter ATP-binding protein